jgi:multidrug efflux pump subunit AcrA (membrane-fusion protein)
MVEDLMESGTAQWLRRGALHGAACLLVLSFLGSGCDRRARGGNPVQDGRQSVAVRVVEADFRPMERKVTALGSLRAIDRATLSIKTTGRLKLFPVDVGSPVRIGDIVAQVEPRDYELRVQQAGALLAQARARLGLPLEGSDDTVDPERVSTVREARALFEEAESNLARIRALQTERILSEAERERAEAEYAVAQNRYIDALQDVQERRAVLAQRRAEYEIARQQLADTSLRAPFDGVVQERLASLGELLMSGSPVVTLVRTDPLRLQADLPERDAHLVREGQVVRMTLEGDTNLHTGQIARISPALEERTRMLRVEAEFANPEKHLRPGRFAKVEIVIGGEPALAIPAGALVRFAGTEKAFLVVTNAALERRLVPGRREGEWVEVLEGLSPGDKVIRDPAGLQSGDPVRVLTGDDKHAS